MRAFITANFSGNHQKKKEKRKSNFYGPFFWLSCLPIFFRHLGQIVSSCQKGARVSSPQTAQLISCRLPRPIFFLVTLSKFRIKKTRPIWVAGRPKKILQPGIFKASRAMPPPKRARGMINLGKLSNKNFHKRGVGRCGRCKDWSGMLNSNPV